jgi:hypothetical protein
MLMVMDAHLDELKVMVSVPYLVTDMDMVPPGSASH